MKDKINVAELLKDCPKGMELDCTIFENLEFDHIDKDNGAYNIICRVKSGCGYYNTHTFTEYGCYSTEKYSKCVIFPKGKTTWEGFHRPFKDGDIIYIRDEYSDATFTYVAILKHVEKGGQVYSHCFYNYEDAEFSTDDYLYDIYRIRFATEKEKEELFDVIKANGYKWNEETKTLDNLVELKFKVGDRIKQIGSDHCYIIKNIEFDRYILNNDQFIRFADEDIYELVPNKFDITTLVPFESKVLARDAIKDNWYPGIWGYYDNDKDSTYPYKLIGDVARYCIPYEGNEHLLGTTDDCDEYFKAWKK